MFRILFSTAVVTVFVFSFIPSGDVSAADSASLLEQFASPSRDYSSGPLWVWNDRLTETQIRQTLRDLAGQHVKQVWVHPRPGLMTPYLGKEWFALWRVALDEAERLDMNVWIYDENSYPSGFAGGLVPEAMPDARGQGLGFREVKQPGALGDEVVAVFRLGDDGYENVTKQARAGTAMPEGRYQMAVRVLAPSSGWFGGKYYVDLLKPGVTEKFLEITMGAYEREMGRYFGGRIPGVFTDEPHLSPAGGIHWSDRFPEDFQCRWGYNLVDHLPSLVKPVGPWKRVRHNFQQFLLEAFIEHWSKPCHDYCEKHDLEFTGHYWEHGWPGASHGPDNMAMYAWHQRPAIDNLMNCYDEGVHGQFGNARTVKELASVANQCGRKRTLCEAYGAGGWDLRLEDMKRIGDWLYVLGVNTLNEHLSYVTIRGARKRDHPQSFSYHAPWWEAYHTMADYFTRLSLALSEGEQINHALLLEPTTTAWMYQPDGSTKKDLDTIGNAFQDMVNRLERAQAEYDIGSEDIMRRRGRIEEGSDGVPATVVVGRRAYDLVVLPPRMENLNGPTVELLEKYVVSGGRVLCCGEPPSRVDGQETIRGSKLASTTSWERVDVEEAIAAMRGRAEQDGLAINRDECDRGILFHHRRRLDDGEILFLVNTSIEESSSGSFSSWMQGVEQWDLETGSVEPYPFTASEEGVRAEYALPPCGSLLLFLSKQSRNPAPVETKSPLTLKPDASPTIRRLGPNVLTLDYVDARVDGEEKKNVYFYKAQAWIFQKHGLAGNPWDSAVQLHDQLISKKFPAGSGFEATYHFTIEGEVPRPLWMVLERPDLYHITCNGQPVAPEPGAWWLDKAFGKIDLSRAARSGVNEVTIQASPMTMYHELEPAYLLGEFSLKPVESGFVVTEPRPFRMKTPEGKNLGWNEQGCPFYSEGVSYTETFEISKPRGRYRVVLPRWRGSVAKVRVNGQSAGYIAHQPWACDVTDWIIQGKNTIEVVVIGTLRNTLGPHHAGAMVGRAWPHAFRQGPETGPPPGKQYSTLAYGMFEPFVLEKD